MCSSRLTHFKGHESDRLWRCHQEHRHGLRLPARARWSSTPPASLRCSREPVPGCRRCATRVRPTTPSPTTRDSKAVIDYDKCVGCGRCIGACNFDAVYAPATTAPTRSWTARWPSTPRRWCHGRPSFHISLVHGRISPNCDCHGENDAPILPDVGHVCLL